MSVTLMCMALVFLMALRMNSNIATAAEVSVFRTLASVAIMEMVTQCMWVINTSTDYAFSVPVQYLYNLLDLLCTGLISYFWYRFVILTVTRREVLLKQSRDPGIIHMIPITLLVICDSLSLITHQVFYITDAGLYTRGPSYWIQIVLCYLYLVIVVITLIQAKVRHTLSRRTFVIYLLFTFLPSAGGVLQVLLPGDAPFTAIFFVLGMFLMFSELQNRRINTDALPGLNNRARAAAYLAGRIVHAEKDPFCLFMADIDSFKQINDRYGHLMGDEALIVIADSFRSMGKSTRTLFASRYGGDEFLCTVSLSETTPEDFRDAFNATLKENLQNAHLPFSLTVSMGYATATDTIPVKQLILDADESLYACKRALHGKQV